jgi:hypothetical protein
MLEYTLESLRWLGRLIANGRVHCWSFWRFGGLVDSSVFGMKKNISKERRPSLRNTSVDRGTRKHRQSSAPAWLEQDSNLL